MTRSLLVLGAATYQLDAIRLARTIGLRVLTADNVPTNPGHREADAAFDVSTVDVDGILELARREHVSGIIAPATDVAVPTVASVCRQLALPGPPVDVVQCICSKIAFRGWQRDLHFPHPRWQVCQADRIEDVARAWGLEGSLPAVLKPNCSSGSKGVFKVSRSEEIQERHQESAAYSLDRQVLLEQFLPGHQGTAEGWLTDGRLALCVLTDRLIALPQSLGTIGHRVPTSLSGSEQTTVLTELKRLFERLGLTDGPFDVDYIVSDGVPVVLEVAARVGGNFVTRLVRSAAGVDLTEAAIRFAVGETVVVSTPGRRRATAIEMLGAATGARTA